jgi:AcrR family transcriptional regulator
MPRTVKPRRAYDSPRRRQQALATRRAVLDAARELFIQGGYVATTIDATAARAGVSPETVYATFKNKRALLSQLLDVAIAGDDAPVPILERSWVQQLRDQADPQRRLQILARNGRLILEQPQTRRSPRCGNTPKPSASRASVSCCAS